MLEKLKRRKKKDATKVQERLKYLYTDYIHPSYFQPTEETKDEIVCAFCKKVQGDTKFDMCSLCKKVYYCSKDCQVKDWKAGHKTVCGGKH